MEDEIKETLEDQANRNNAPAGEDLDAIRAQLEEEKTARAALETTLVEKDDRIAELERDFSEAVTLGADKAKELEASVLQLAALKDDRDDALGHYLDMAKAANPNVPETIIAGATIAEIDASIEKGKTIVESVRASMESEAAKTKVPAGAPPRGAISTEGLTAREKIAAGILPKGQNG